MNRDETARNSAQVIRASSLTRRSANIRVNPPSPAAVSVSYDALLLISFGGPERSRDVIPFLENVVRGKEVPRERLLAVAEHYELFGGFSPSNAQNRALLAALVNELNAHGPALPVYWGNRHWHPMLADTLRQMADDGIQHALAFVTSAFSSYPGCRAYLEDIEHARQEVGENAPQVDKLRVFYNHPGFIEPMAERLQAALAEIPAERRTAARVIYTAHSLPLAMAQACPYQQQLREACRLVSERVGLRDWQLVYQSRSGPPSQPWLEPDIGNYLRQWAGDHPGGDVVVVPIGFVSEHMEIVYDLDLATRSVCEQLRLNMVRAAVVGCHGRFVQMIRELINERIQPYPERLALGPDGPFPDHCPPDCCPGS
ncbi:MAG: ferrochelatase [Pirellulales bacterium]|nr:ferrochelatase [Pirellulales bacterium]